MHSGVHETAVIGNQAQWRGKETKYPVEIHPTAYVGPFCQIDAGCERPTIVGKDTIVMGQSHLGHGAQVGEHCDIAQGTILGGEVTIGDHVRTGIGVLIKPYLTVGDGARIGMGAVVIEDVLPYTCVAGNPAKWLYNLCPNCRSKLEQRRFPCGDRWQEILWCPNDCTTYTEQEKP